MTKRLKVAQIVTATLRHRYDMINLGRCRINAVALALLAQPHIPQKSGLPQHMPSLAVIDVAAAFLPLPLEDLPAFRCPLALAVRAVFPS